MLYIISDVYFSISDIYEAVLYSEIFVWNSYKQDLTLSHLIFLKFRTVLITTTSDHDSLFYSFLRHFLMNSIFFYNHNLWACWPVRYFIDMYSFGFTNVGSNKE